MPLDREKAKRLGRTIVKFVGEYVAQNQAQVKLAGEKEKENVVTNIDQEAEELVWRFLREEFPAHGYVGEEKQFIGEDPEYTWYVDPIDGTRHYMRGLPFFSVSLALKQGEETILGFVYAPSTKELFFAEQGEGAYLNETPIHVSTQKELKGALLCIELPTSHQNPANLTKSLSIVGELAKHPLRMRALGYSALGLCYVAKGGFDGYLDFSNTTKSIDYMAAELIVKEAGGTVEHLSAEGPLGVLATNGEMHEVLMKAIEIV